MSVTTAERLALAVCNAADVPEEGGLRVLLPELEPLAVFRVGALYFVTADTCTHGDASLCDGELLGLEIYCPYHFGAFDLRSGAPTQSPCTEPLRVYPCDVRDGVVYIAAPPAG